MELPSGWWPDNAHGFYNCSLGDWVGLTIMHHLGGKCCDKDALSVTSCDVARFQTLSYTPTGCDRLLMR